jgi:hypothetical protein
MELDSKLDEMFDATCIAKKDNARDTSIVDLKKLETQLNNHLRAKQGKKYKRVGLFNFSEQEEYKNAFNDMIDNEIENKYKNKKWSMLPMFLRWQYTEKYLKDNNIYNKKMIKLSKDFINNRDDQRFEYDNKEGIILKILFDDMI